MKMHRHTLVFTLFVWCIALFAINIVLSGCRDDTGIKVGFVGGLTGRLSGLSVAGRNGVLLAVEEANQTGGINGRPIELIIKDNCQDPQMAVKAVTELIDEKVVAIIGHMTSAMSMATRQVIDNNNTLMISPTTSTNKLSGIDDNFIRMLPPNKSETDHLARHAYEAMNMRNIAAVYDLSNRAFTEEFFNNFKTEFEKMGGRLVNAQTFSSGRDIDFLEMTELLLGAKPDGLLLIAGAPDAALFCQHLRRKNGNIKIISSGWAMTVEFIHHGSHAVNDVLFSQVLPKQSREKVYLDFRERFKARFGHEPNFAAAHGYEAARMLFDALSSTDDPKGLKQAIMNLDAVFGVQGDFRIDEFGDPVRRRYLMTVRNGQFITLD